MKSSFSLLWKWLNCRPKVADIFCWRIQDLLWHGSCRACNSSFNALMVFPLMLTCAGLDFGNQTGELHRKSTRLVTRSQALISQLIGHRCLKDHEHAPVIGGSQMTQAAGHYTKAFSDAVIKAFQNQFDFETLQLFKDRPGSNQITTDDAVEVNLVDSEVLGLEAGESDDSLEVGPVDEKLGILPEIKSAVYRLRINTGHRSPKRLARALVISGAPHAAVAAKNLQCARRSPKPRPPGGLPPPREVGQQIHLDLVLLEDSMRRSYVIAHATDNVSRYQAAQGDQGQVYCVCDSLSEDTLATASWMASDHCR